MCAQDFATEIDRVLAHPRLAGSVLLRTYVYDAPPASGIVEHPITGQRQRLDHTDVFAHQQALHDQLELMPDVALRRGEIAVRGWRVRDRAVLGMAKSGRALTPDDLELNLQQKGVDLRVGLDIARLALRQMVDTIVVMTGDSDLVPAFKFARREGVRVGLDHLDAQVRRELRAHADFVLAPSPSTAP